LGAARRRERLSVRLIILFSPRVARFSDEGPWLNSWRRIDGDWMSVALAFAALFGSDALSSDGLSRQTGAS
jgi:hypothetical protein